MFLLVEGASGSAPTDLPTAQELPPEAVAAVLYPPVDLQTISKADFKRAIVQAAAQAHLKRVPSPGQKGHRKLKVSAMKNLLDESWIQGQAAEMGIRFTPGEVAVQVAQIKRMNFKSIADYKRFLKTSHLNQADVNELVKLQLLVTAIQAKVLRGVKGKKMRRQVFTRFVAEYTKRWRSRTVCAPGYVFGRCSNAHARQHQGTLG
jgi:hypothetical protein